MPVTDQGAGAPSDHSNVLVIVGSTRAGRLGPAIADWVVAIARECTDLNYEIADLAEWPLPMNDEPGVPKNDGYLQPHTRAWSETVARADAIIFITPQYNWGYPAPLKNAIDHLYKEWNGKPALIVSYGGHGGGKCADQLRQVTEGLRMRPVATMPGIVLTEAMIHGGPCDPERDFAAHVGSVRQAVFELSDELDGAGSS